MSDTSLRVVIAGGGTGGHLFPGLAIAREILARRPDAVVTFAGTARGIEARAVPAAGFELDTIRSLGLKGKSPRRPGPGRGHAAALRGRRDGRHRPPAAARRHRRRRLQLGADRGRRLAAPRAGAAARAERAARPHQPSRGPCRARHRPDLRARPRRASARRASSAGTPFAPSSCTSGQSHRGRGGCSSLAAPRARTRSTWPWSRQHRSWRGPRFLRRSRIRPASAISRWSATGWLAPGSPPASSPSSSAWTRR